MVGFFNRTMQRKPFWLATNVTFLNYKKYKKGEQGEFLSFSGTMAKSYAFCSHIFDLSFFFLGSDSDSAKANGAEMGSGSSC